MNNVLKYTILSVLIGFFLLACDQQGSKKQEKGAAHVPQWSKGIVWYQIFPERFRNGDTTNDPTFSDIQGAWPHDRVLPWENHPWTSDWYALQPYETANGKDLWYNISRRRYGGDLQGIIDRLDYLKDLGIGALYLNPVFMSPSSHKYDATCYHHIDPTFGPDPLGDRQIMAGETPDDPATWKWTSADSLMLRLIEEVHERDMKIIFDGVFNHIGSSSFAFQDVLINQQNSRFKDWFFIRSFGDSVQGTLLEFKGWSGVQDMPELREDENGMAEGPKNYIYAVTRRWMDPMGTGDISKGIDGWRLDVADQNSHNFWKDWSALVRSINPDAYLTGEVIAPTDQIKPYINPDEFDAVMNYNFLLASSQYFLKGKHIFPTSRFDSLLNTQRIAFPEDVNLAMQNLLGSHDTDRPASRIVNRRTFSFLDKDRFFNETKASNRMYKTEKPKKADNDLLKSMVIFQMTYPGAPMIYYGDEAGMWGAKDPCCRKPMVWDDISYTDETFLPNGMQKRSPEKVMVYNEILNHYKKLIRIRNTHKALQLGDFETILTDDKNEIYCFSRSYKNEKIYVMLNNSPDLHNISVKVDDNGLYYNALDENRELIVKDGTISTDLTGNWGAIWVKGK